MTINKRTSNDGNTVFLDITGPFDYNITREFRDAYNDDKSQAGITYFINLSNVSYIDSSALGILLLLREHTNSCKGKVIIEQPGEKVYQVLKTAHFDKLFTINNSSTKPDYLELVK